MTMTFIATAMIAAVALVAAAVLFIVLLAGFCWCVRQCDNLPF